LSIVTGIVTVVCVYRAGRDLFSARVGLLAAAALAFMPSAVEWSSRVRMYALYQLLATLGVYATLMRYLGKGALWGVLGTLALLSATLAHTLALTVWGGLIVGLVLCWLLFRRHRRIPRPTWGEAVALAVAAACVVAVNPVGGMWGVGIRLSDLASGVLTASSAMDRLATLLGFTHQFVVRPLWPLTVMYVVGFINLARRKIRGSPVRGDALAWCLYALGIIAWGVTALTSRLYSTRYLYGILPVYLWLSFREVGSLLAAVRAALQESALGLGLDVLAACALVVALLVPSTVRLVRTQVVDLAPAFEFVRDRWRAGDAIATDATVVSWLVLGRADYYLTQIAPEAIGGRNALIGSPLIDTTAELADAMARHPRMWLVLEEAAWEHRLDEAFQAYVREKARLVMRSGRMLVFVAP